MPLYVSVTQGYIWVKLLKKRSILIKSDSTGHLKVVTLAFGHPVGIDILIRCQSTEFIIRCCNCYAGINTATTNSTNAFAGLRFDVFRKYRVYGVEFQSLGRVVVSTSHTRTWFEIVSDEAKIWIWESLKVT